ncbi:MAG TPA: type IV pilus secretin PilQ [Candidatus Angelobacter sp.]|nr:type IV pilus secretin PilQ [Candidatus Angelobacter sp.]
MRRLKQLLGTILLAAMTSTASATSASLLSGVRVDTRDNAGVVTIQASGNFTHTEYRPTDSLILVDLAGVSLAHPDTQLHSVSVPGVLSWRVVGYRYASGAEVARVELNLAPGAQVKVADVDHGVELRVVGASSPATAQLADTKSAEPKKLLPSGNVASSALAAKISGPSHIRNVAIVRGKDGLDVEITANGPIAASTMKLGSPDRLVVDIPNSILDGMKREIAVNGSSVKDIRVARYQNTPPSTRVVLDLLSARDFEVVPGANKLVVKLKDPVIANPKLPVNVQREQKAQLASQQPVPATSMSEKADIQPLPDKAAEVKSAEARSVETKSAETKMAPAYVITEPKFTAAQAEKPAELPKSSEQVRAEIAAAHFAAPETTTSSSPAANTPPFPSSASLAASPAMVNAALLQQQQQAQPAVAPANQISGCNTGRYTGEPFSINAKDVDLKDFFRAIHEFSGLNIVLDQAVHGSLTIVLDDVPWDQALAIVLSNNGLDCVLQGNVLRIATIDTLRAEAESRHAQQDAQALAVPKQTVTRYLSYGHSKDVVPIIKKFLSPRGDVVSDDRSNALIIEDIPSVIPKIDALLPLLDRKTPEVEIEARVVSASRSFARDIGTQLGVGWGDRNNAVAGLPGNPSPIIDHGSNPALIFDQAAAGAIPLFSNLPASGNAGLSLLHNNGLFRLDFILSLAENRGLAKILSRPRIITFNNVKAVIKQGQKIPIVTPAQLGGPPTVTYLDVVLRLTVTPQITAEHTIFLDIDVESTSINGKFQAGVNPSLNTAQATTQVLVSDGGTVVVGGVIVTQNTITVDQVPLLGDIPVLGNLFKHRAVSTSTNELIFFITPRILET